MARMRAGVVLALVFGGCSRPAAPCAPADVPDGGNPPQPVRVNREDAPPNESAEEKAIRFVEGLGGRVERDNSKPGKPVTAVYMRSKATNAELKELANFKHLTVLSLQLCARITDAGFAELAPLTNLTTLDLGYTKVTD